MCGAHCERGVPMQALQKERMSNTFLASYTLASMTPFGTSLPLYNFMKAQIRVFLLPRAIDFVCRRLVMWSL